MTSVEVVADRDTVLAFALGGVRGRAVGNADEASAAVSEIAAATRQGDDPEHATILIVSRGVAERMRDLLDRVALDPRGPLVVELPGFADAAGETRVERLLERVLGRSG